MIRESELWPQLCKRWIVLRRGRGGGVLLGILGRSVPTGSPNPDPYLELASKIHTRFQTWRHYLD